MQIILIDHSIHHGKLAAIWGLNDHYHTNLLVRFLLKN